MDMIAKLPEMTDDALSNLRSNAKRLQQTGSQNQRSDAALLLPAVEAEIGARRLAKAKAARAAAKDKPRAVRPRKPSRRPAASESE